MSALRAPLSLLCENFKKQMERDLFLFINFVLLLQNAVYFQKCERCFCNGGTYSFDTYIKYMLINTL